MTNIFLGSDNASASPKLQPPSGASHQSPAKHNVDPQLPSRTQSINDKPSVEEPPILESKSTPQQHPKSEKEEIPKQFLQILQANHNIELPDQYMFFYRNAIKYFGEPALIERYLSGIQRGQDDHEDFY